ncbi:DNA alkylation repair protein [Candidatus Sumerlaeota bacterium]|nr:DNA alkylation repair protein [Candidatus Sumerlaeota bacterium]
MPNPSAEQVQTELRALHDPARAKIVMAFFKTGKGGYGEGDVFLGLTVPQVRAVAKSYRGLEMNQIDALLASKFHEERLIALVILVNQCAKGNDSFRKRAVDLYLGRTNRINNWDLVDCSARAIVGRWVREKKQIAVLRKLAASNNLWERRIAIIATHDFSLAGDVNPTMEISRMLLDDNHDLIHKATGWMLREAGKVDATALLRFLAENHAKLPRTTLRYAIERFPPEQRKKMLKGNYPNG